MNAGPNIQADFRFVSTIPVAFSERLRMPSTKKGVVTMKRFGFR